MSSCSSTNLQLFITCTCLSLQNILPTAKIHLPANSSSLIYYFGKYTYLFYLNKLLNVFYAQFHVIPKENTFIPHFTDEKSKACRDEVH